MSSGGESVRDFKLVFQMLCIKCVCAHEGHMGEVMRLTLWWKNELQIQECNERSGF